MEIYICIYLFIIGAIMGSFLACMGYRIPNKIKTTYPSSFCPCCKKKLKWYMNIPIFSYILLGGKCLYCKKKIGFIYFLCEILCPILYVVGYLKYGFTYDFFIFIILSSILITVIVSDFLYFYISDRVLIIGGILTLICALVFKTQTELLSLVVSAVILFLVMIGLKILGNSMFGSESLGDGDIKLMAVIGLSLGLINSFIGLFFASLIALIYGIIVIKFKKSNIIPFGPFILIGSLLVLYFSNYITLFIDTFFSI